MVIFMFVVGITMLALVLANIAVARTKIIDEIRTSRAQMDERIHRLEQMVSVLKDHALLTKEERGVKWFDELQSLGVEDFKGRIGGASFDLVVCDNYDVSPIDFTLKELVFRTDGERDAVVHGDARLRTGVGAKSFPVKIYINQYSGGAKLTGLPMEGAVKKMTWPLPR